MKEQQLHHLWKWRKLPVNGLQLTGGEVLVILDPGTLNGLSGPDFLNAHIRIGETCWVGHVELHVKSSDWYAHGHQEDPNYQNVILHVVWEHNREVLAANGLPLPTLQVRDYVSEKLLITYHLTKVPLEPGFLKCGQGLGELPLDLKNSFISDIPKQLGAGLLYFPSERFRTQLQCTGIPESWPTSGFRSNSEIKAPGRSARVFVPRDEWPAKHT